MAEGKNIFDLSRSYWNWAFENPEKVKPIHTAIYFFALEHCNRLGWKSKFGLPTSMTMEAIGVKSYRSYKKHLDELVEFGFITMVEYSKNQYSSNIIAIAPKTKARDKALDKATVKHGSKQGQSTGQSSASIDKPINQYTNIPDSIYSFQSFWNDYSKKTDKVKCEKKYSNISEKDRALIKAAVPLYVRYTQDVQYRKNPLTWLNGKCWNDETEQPKREPRQHAVL